MHISAEKKKFIRNIELTSTLYIYTTHVRLANAGGGGGGGGGGGMRLMRTSETLENCINLRAGELFARHYCARARARREI